MAIHDARHACYLPLPSHYTLFLLYLLSQRLVKVVTSLLLELSLMLVRLTVRYLNRSLPNPILCVLDILEVLVEDIEQPRFLPWEFKTSTIQEQDTF